MMPKVVIAIVLYNDVGGLQKIVSDLNSSSINPECTIFIDNSDQNIVLKNAAIIRGISSSSIHIVNSQNIGSSGGFSQAMKECVSLDAEWILLLDQDGGIRSDCLEHLINASCMGDVLCAKVEDIESGIEEPTFRTRKNFWGRSVPLAKHTHTEVPIDYFGSHGTMISTTALKKTGFYDTEHFFVGYEDFDYALRIKRDGFKILLVNDAIVYHPSLYKKKAAKTAIARTTRYVLKVIEVILPFTFGTIKNHRKCLPISTTYSASYLSAYYCRSSKALLNLCFNLISVTIKKIVEPNAVQLFDTLMAIQRGYHHGRRNYSESR